MIAFALALVACEPAAAPEKADRTCHMVNWADWFARKPDCEALGRNLVGTADALAKPAVVVRFFCLERQVLGHKDARALADAARDWKRAEPPGR